MSVRTRISTKAKPFLKWVGGKTQLLSKFSNYYPYELRTGLINKYFEPFIGGGAVFFNIIQQFKIPETCISDLNQDLVLAYKTIQFLPTELFERLEELQYEFNNTSFQDRNKLFLTKRESFNKGRFNFDYTNYTYKWAERTSLLIFLNKTCFNGLYRINSKGGFNVPFGKYKKATILNTENLISVSKALQNTEIRCCSYKEIYEYVDEFSFVYIDPPYRPLNISSSFTNYTKNGFGDTEQIELSNFVKRLNQEKSAKFMLSNSDPKNTNSNDNFFDDLYADFNIYRVSAGRAINSNGQKRGKIKEILVTNYDYEPQTLEFNF